MKKIILLFLLTNTLFYQISAGEVPSPSDRFLTGICRAADGSWWVTAENGNVTRIRGASDRTVFTPGRRGMPETDSFTAVCEDSQHRIWVGTVNAGVAVWNGKKWKNYGIENGPLAPRVYALACSQKEGRVAVGHSFGVSLYHPGNGRWRELGVLDGLPNTGATSLAFADDGSLWIGYDTAGLAHVRLNGKGKTDFVRTSWFFDKEKRSHVPLCGAGTGLPSNLINALAVRGKWVYCGTVNGLAYSRDNGKSWKFLRGMEWKGKIAGLRLKTAVSKKNNRPLSGLLPEDYVVSLCPDENGVWIGTRTKGVCYFSNEKEQIVPGAEAQDLPESCFVNALERLPDGSVLAATYGHGLLAASGNPQFVNSAHEETSAMKFPAENIPLDSKGVDELLRKADQLCITRPTRKAWAEYFREDWVTKGDWCQRYGRDLAILCGVNCPNGSPTYSVDSKADGFIYPFPSQPNDTLRFWTQWFHQPQRNTLQRLLPPLRSESEWDDHGETYSQLLDGPDVWIAMELRSDELYRAAFYFYSPNNRSPRNCERDYLLELYENETKYNETPNFEKVLKQPVLARARAFKLGTGVYKEFLLTGARRYLLRICRNYSMNTILNGIFTSCFYDEGTPYYDARNHFFDYGWLYPHPGCSHQDINPQFVPEDAAKIWRLTEIPSARLAAGVLSPARMQMYRIAKSTPKCDPYFLKLLEWRMMIWTPEERTEFDRLRRDGYHKEQETWIFLRAKETNRHGPDTVNFTCDELKEMEKMKISWRDYLPDAGKPPKISEEEMHRILKERLAQKQGEK